MLSVLVAQAPVVLWPWLRAAWDPCLIVGWASGLDRAPPRGLRQLWPKLRAAWDPR